MGEEKRKFTRVAFGVNGIIDFNNKEYLVGLDNLSLKGCFTKMDPELMAEFNSGDIADIRLKSNEVTSSMNMNIKAMAIRVDGSGGVGWEFKSLELDTFIYLRDLIGYNSGDTDKITKEFVEYVEASTEKKK